jgi:hypothetical protein
MQGLLKEMFFFYSCQNLIGRVGGDCPLASGSDGPNCRFYIRYANYLAVKCTAAADYNGLIVVAGKATLFSILLFLCNSSLQAPAKVFLTKSCGWLFLMIQNLRFGPIWQFRINESLGVFITTLSSI